MTIKKNVYPTYIEKLSDKEPKRLTKEVFERLIHEKSTSDNVKKYRETGDEKYKRNLPAIAAQGYFSEELAQKWLNTKSLSGKEHTGRQNPCFQPSDKLGLDIDGDDVCTMTVEQQFRHVWERIEKHFGEKPEDIVICAYKTPSYQPGDFSKCKWRMIVKRQKGLTIEQLQAKWDKILAYPCDKKCKELARQFLLTPAADFLYDKNIDMLFTIPEDYNPKDYPTASTDTVQHKASKPGKHRRGKQKIKAKQQAQQEKYTDDYLQDVFQALESLYFGGAALPGNRNTQVFQIAHLMAYLTKDITKLQRIIPAYGLSGMEHLRTIKSAIPYATLPYFPIDLQRALDTVNATKDSEKQTSVYDNNVQPPRLPENLPPAIEHILSILPEKTHAAAALCSFSAWRIYLERTNFLYIDGTAQEPSFFNLTVARQASGKNSTNIVCKAIAQERQEEELIYREKEREWREKTATLGATKDKEKAPQKPIQIISPDITPAKLVQRLQNAGDRCLYIYSTEFSNIQEIKNLSQITRSAYDGTTWGSERVGAQSADAYIPHMRLVWCASTTPAHARLFFRGEVENGTGTRITLSTLLDDDVFAEDFLVYGQVDAKYKEGIKMYIDNIKKAAGTIQCQEALEWAKREHRKQRKILSEAHNKTLIPYERRAVQQAYWRGLLLYIMHNYQWTKEIEDFCSWSVDYDLWVKNHYFGDYIVQTDDVIPDNSKYSTSIFAHLPDTFTRQQARETRQSLGLLSDSKHTRDMIAQWKARDMIRSVDTDVWQKVKHKAV